MPATPRLVALSVVLALAGCASPAKPTASPPAAPSVAASSASPTPSPAGGGHRLGDTVAYPDVPGLDVTAQAYQQPVASGAPPPNGQPRYTWGGLQVKACLGAAVAGTVGVSERPWVLLYADGSQARPSNIKYQQFPLPAYPIDDRTLSAGQCAAGWIVFPVPAGAKPATVEYAPAGESVLDWAVD